MKIHGATLSQQADQQTATSSALASASPAETTELGHSLSAVVDLSPQALRFSKEPPKQQTSLIKLHGNIDNQGDAENGIKPHGNVGHP